MKELPEAKEWFTARHGKKFGSNLAKQALSVRKTRSIWLTIITEENGDTLSTILNDKILIEFTNFFIFDMINLKIA